MKKRTDIILISLLFLVVLSGSSCQQGEKSRQQETGIEQKNTRQTIEQTKKESETQADTEATVETGGTAQEKDFPEEGIKTLIVYDASDKRLEEIAVEIQRKIGGVIYELSEERGEYTKAIPELASYELILIGGRNQSEQLTEETRTFLETTDFQGKRVSPFWLNDEQEQTGTDNHSASTTDNTTGYEQQFQTLIQNGKVLPGIELSWEESQRKAELGQIDGWLTSACTLK